MITLFADASTNDYPGVVQNTAQKWSEIFVSSFQSAFGQIVSVLPNLLAMIAILLVGYLIARIVGRIAAAISEKIGLQTAAERSGLVASMQQVGIKRSVPSIVGLMFFWLLMCVFLTAGFNILGWEGLSSGMAVSYTHLTLPTNREV